MRIPLFYSFAFLLIAGMVLYALKPGLERALEWRRVLQTVPTVGLVIEGEQLLRLIVNEGASVEVQGEAGAERALIGSSGVVASDANYGAHYLVPAEAVRRLRGAEVDIVFEVRAAPEHGATEWLSRVVIPGLGDTGWTAQSAGQDWSSVGLRIAIPQGDIRDPMDVMLWSDARGDSGRIELRRLAVRPVGRAAGGGS